MGDAPRPLVDAAGRAGVQRFAWTGRCAAACGPSGRSAARPLNWPAFVSTMSRSIRARKRRARAVSRHVDSLAVCRRTGSRAAAPMARSRVPSASRPALIDTLLVELAERLDDDEPFAVFGHSMGALVGLELIHALRARHGLAPVWFGASASLAPSRRNWETHWLDCTHEAMVARLRELGGTPVELLDDRDFIDFVLPALRVDFHLCGTYAPLATAGGCGALGARLPNWRFHRPRRSRHCMRGRRCGLA